MLVKLIKIEGVNLHPLRTDHPGRCGSRAAAAKVDLKGLKICDWRFGLAKGLARRRRPQASTSSLATDA